MKVVADPGPGDLGVLRHRLQPGELCPRAAGVEVGGPGVVHTHDEVADEQRGGGAVGHSPPVETRRGEQSGAQWVHAPDEGHAVGGTDLLARPVVAELLDPEVLARPRPEPVPPAAVVVLAPDRVALPDDDQQVLTCQVHGPGGARRGADVDGHPDRHALRQNPGHPVGASGPEPRHMGAAIEDRVVGGEDHPVAERLAACWVRTRQVAPRSDTPTTRAPSTSAPPRSTNAAATPAR